MRHQIKIEYEENFPRPCFDSSKSYFYDVNYPRVFNILLRTIVVPKLLSLGQALKSFKLQLGGKYVINLENLFQ